jgi:O-antigen/teichoic acid export membrane protein
MFDNVRRVTRQVAAYGTADVADLAIRILLFPFYTQVLTPDVIGALAVLQTVEALIKVLYRWGLDTSYLRLFYEQRTEEARRSLAGTIALFLVTANGAVLLALLLASGVVTRAWGGLPSFHTAFVLLVVNSFLANFLFLPLTMFRAREQATRVMRLTTARSLATIACRVLLVLVWRFGLLGLVASDVIVTTGMLIALLPSYRAMLGGPVSRPLLRESLHYGLPQVPYGLLYQAMGFADRPILATWLSLTDVGIYQTGATLAAVVKLVPVAFQNAWMPFALDAHTQRADAARLFARLATYAFAALVFITIAIITLGGSLVTLLLPPHYHPATAILPWLVISAAVQSAAWFPTTSLNIAKATRYYPGTTAIAAVVTITAELSLVPQYGMYGVAFGAIVGQVIQTVAVLVFAQRVYRIPYETTRLVKVLVVGAAIAAAGGYASTGTTVLTLLARVGILACFPLGLFVAQLFTPAELRDMRALVAAARTRIRPETP